MRMVSKGLAQLTLSATKRRCAEASWGAQATKAKTGKRADATL